MKSLAALSIVFSVFLFSCKTEGTSADVTSVESQKYVINTARDTIIKTMNGALLDIRAGTVIAEKGTKVTLEVKEAYRIDQMIAARLYTTSNGQPLSSGGMIYINPTKGQQVRLTGSIGISLPTRFFQDSMSLFKGETTADGSINWTKPDSLPLSEKQKELLSGKALFDSKCGSCHGIGEVKLDPKLKNSDMTGKIAPDLAHFTKRFKTGEEFTQYYQHNVSVATPDTAGAKMLTEVIGESADSVRNDTIDLRSGLRHHDYNHLWYYKCNLRHIYSSSPEPQPIQKLITAEQEHLIYEYIENESDRLNAALPEQAELFDCIDSCLLYTKLKDELNAKRIELSSRRTNLKNKNGSLVNERKVDTATPVNDTTQRQPPPNTRRDTVPMRYLNAEYYQFTIESFGWFNIDILLKDIVGDQRSELFVSVIGEYRSRTEVFLVLPAHRVYVKGRPSGRSADEYIFDEANGKFPLPLNNKAYIIALFEGDDKFGYSITEFITSIKHDLQVSPEVSTPNKFKDDIIQLRFKGLDITVAPSRNADSIRILDATLKNIDQKIGEAELLKPSNCECRCGEEGISPK